MPQAFRAAVATYNVLCSSLCSPSFHVGSQPMWLEEQTRYLGLVAKLNPLMEEQRAIICLQEVSSLWAGRLHAFFQQRGYYFVFSGYGYRSSGYMGCGIAFPSKDFELQTCSTPCIADTKERWPARRKPSFAERLWGYLMKPFKVQANQESEWDLARRKTNTMVFLRLKSKMDNDATICVGTYHMPCAFRTPKVMVIHAALAAQKFQSLAGKDPYVFAGDFNFQPRDSCYRLLTEGRLPDNDEAMPAPMPGDKWQPVIKWPMKSAYREADGTEPDHTNWSKTIMTKKQDYIGTLDYLFYGNGLEVDSAARLPHRSEAKGPYPNATEPSDHILLSAVFRLPLSQQPVQKQQESSEDVGIAA